MRVSNNKEFEDAQNALLVVLILIVLRLLRALPVQPVELPLQLAKLSAQNVQLDAPGQTQHQSANRVL